MLRKVYANIYPADKDKTELCYRIGEQVELIDRLTKRITI